MTEVMNPDFVTHAFRVWDVRVLPADLAAALGDWRGPWRGGGVGFTRHLRADLMSHLRSRISEQCGYDMLRNADEVHDAMRVADAPLTLILHHMLAAVVGADLDSETDWKSPVEWRLQP